MNGQTGQGGAWREGERQREGDARAIRVVVCDDHALFRAGMQLILRSQPDIELAGEAADGQEAIALAARLQPDVMLMDIRMPHLDGIEATERIVSAMGEESPRIIVLTTIDMDDAVARAARAGANGFVLKAGEPELVLAAIRTVHAGGQLFSANSAVELIRGTVAPAAAAPPPEYETLSGRERDIFQLVARGLSNQEIAEREYLSPGTVKTHVSSILARLGLRSRIQVVVYAYEHGLVPGGSEAE